MFQASISVLVWSWESMTPEITACVRQIPTARAAAPRRLGPDAQSKPYWERSQSQAAKEGDSVRRVGMPGKARCMKTGGSWRFEEQRRCGSDLQVLLSDTEEQHQEGKEDPLARTRGQKRWSQMAGHPRCGARPWTLDRQLCSWAYFNN